MIAFVRGAVVSASADHVIVDIGAVGLTVQCTPATALGVRQGEHVEFRTTMVVREDGWTLYGFLDPDERTVFEQVQTVSGIGPRIALALLGTLSPDELRSAVSANDEATLTRVPGIGRKGAQRLILELRDKIGVSGSASGQVPARAVGGTGWQVAVSAGLTSLGWSAREADQAVAALDPALAERATEAGDRADIGALLKAALRTLDRS